MTVDRGVRVGVLYGGRSSEREVSLRSGAAVHEALVRRGWDAVLVDVGADLASRLAAEGVQVAWLALHGRQGEDGCVQGMLEVLGVPYTGSGVLASAVAMDKHRTKRLLAGERGIRLAPHVLVAPGDARPEALGLPVVVKPAIGGSTVGVTLVRDEAGWDAAVAKAAAEHPLVMAEAYVPGDEITVAVLDGAPLPLVRIEPDGGFYSYDAKYVSGGTRYTCPAPVSDVVAVAATSAAVQAYTALGCRGLARVDFLVPGAGDPVLLEVNTLPGMTARSLGPMAAREAGIDFDALVERVLDGARLDP